MSVTQQLQTAVAYHQAGNYAAAEPIYQQVLMGAPNNADALHLLGLLKYQTGDSDTAIELIEQAIRNNPKVADFHNNGGEAYRSLGRLNEAERCYRQAIKLNPQHFMALNNLALVLMELGGLDEAAKHLKSALRIAPNYIEAIYNLGRLLYQQGKLEASLIQLQKVLDLNPDFYPALPLLGNLFHALKQYPEALAAFDKALLLKPGELAVLNSKGLVLMDMGALDEAVELFQQLLSRNWMLSEVHCNLGVALNQLDRMADALESFQQAVSLKPDYVEVQKNIASTLRDTGRVAEAIAAFDQLISQYPEMADAHFGLAFSLLLSGDYKRGWQEYEWRWQSGNSPQLKPKLKGREWQGEPLNNKTILIYCEQGAGDAIQFIRFVPMLAAQGARVLLQCPDALMSLFSQVEGVNQVISVKQKAKGYDTHCPIMSLPLHLGITLENLLADVPYLKPVASVLDAVELDSSKYKIGVVWAGSTLHINNQKRSCPVELFAPLAEIDGVELHSLQKLPKGEVPPSFMIDHSEQLNDYGDTSALIEKLDLVISVDTSVAHLAGALGKAVWILLPHAPDWRWQCEGLRSPWYPTAKLVRQRRAGDWSDVIFQLKKILLQQLTGEEHVTAECIEVNPESAPKIDMPDGFNQMQMCRHGLMLFNKNDAYVGRSLKYYGEFSEGEVDVFDNYLSPGDTVVEVGANIGAHTVYLANKVGLTGSVIAIEPQRIVNQTLCANLALNSISNVVTYLAGAGNKSGEIMVPSIDPNRPHNFGGVSLGGDTGERVPLMTVDSLKLQRCDLLKLDVEGMECDVIAGAVETVKRCKPVMYVENDRREKSADLIGMIRELGYQLWWHRPPLFNAANFAKNENNIFGNIVSLNLLCLPEGVSMDLDLPVVDDPEMPWL